MGIIPKEKILRKLHERLLNRKFRLENEKIHTDLFQRRLRKYSKLRIYRKLSVEKLTQDKFLEKHARNMF